jgi:hypothetical protein
VTIKCTLQQKDSTRTKYYTVWPQRRLHSGRTLASTYQGLGFESSYYAGHRGEVESDERKYFYGKKSFMRLARRVGRTYRFDKIGGGGLIFTVHRKNGRKPIFSDDGCKDFLTIVSTVGDATLGKMTLSIKTLSIRTLNISILSIMTLTMKTLSIKALSIGTHSIRTLSIRRLRITVSKSILGKSTLYMRTSA